MRVYFVVTVFWKASCRAALTHSTEILPNGHVVIAQCERIIWCDHQSTSKTVGFCVCVYQNQIHSCVYPSDTQTTISASAYFSPRIFMFTHKLLKSSKKLYSSLFFFLLLLHNSLYWILFFIFPPFSDHINFNVSHSTSIPNIWTPFVDPK